MLKLYWGAGAESCREAGPGAEGCSIAVLLDHLPRRSHHRLCNPKQEIMDFPMILL